MVKKLEQEMGVVTQLIFRGTAMDIIGNNRVKRYNVIAKMNQKLGGVVVNLEVPPALKQTDPDAHKKAESDWFRSRMFIGLSLSHAGPQSYADRVVGETVKEPSCVGMAFTLGQPGRRTALSWFIEKRRPIIDDLTRHIIRALDLYAETNKNKMPSSILIFRKGMSEGELKKMKQINEALEQIRLERKELREYRPTLQCLVCMSNTPDRLFYKGGSENVPAGTVLEKEATNPDRVEFVIAPHIAIKGTAKPVRCTLVCDQRGRDGRRLSLPELECLMIQFQSVYHSLCYIHGIAGSPTRLPVPLSDSEKAAERQMNNYKEAL
ncbi:hypothetical protein PRIPAC_97743 [Pristionchus pacificus]|nr:hypothetical protein PRIPAC_97743 [Pristionchus pacificus]